jgi:hypothetical protein
METTNNAARQQVVKSAIKVRRIFANDYQKEGTLTAELEQEVTTESFYPSKRVKSEFQSNLFDAKQDFGFEEKEFTSTEKRIAWILVPMNATIEEITKRLAEKKESTIYKVLSCEPILDDAQKYSISIGQRTLDQYAGAQAVRFGAGHPDEGKLILFNGKVQYRRTFFMDKPQVDIDNRSNGKVYLSAALQAELSGASMLQGQTV